MSLNCLTAGAVGVRVRRDLHAGGYHEGGRLRIRLSSGRLSAQRLERVGLRHRHRRVIKLRRYHGHLRSHFSRGFGFYQCVIGRAHSVSAL